MFDVEITYPTMIGRLRVTITNAETVATREEASELREVLRAIPELANASFRIKNAKPASTVDEALERFQAELKRFPVRR